MQKENMADMEEAMSVIDSLEARQKELKNLPDGTDMKGMRLYAVQKALTQAYRVMMDIAKRDDSEATSDEDWKEEEGKEDENCDENNSGGGSIEG